PNFRHHADDRRPWLDGRRDRRRYRSRRFVWRRPFDVAPALRVWPTRRDLARDRHGRPALHRPARAAVSRAPSGADRSDALSAHRLSNIALRPDTYATRPHSKTRGGRIDAIVSSSSRATVRRSRTTRSLSIRAMIGGVVLRRRLSSASGERPSTSMVTRDVGNGG